MYHTDDEATLWIGYADFLTTLVILFFVIAVVVVRQATNPSSGFIVGSLVDATNRDPISGCKVALGDDDPVETAADGQFSFEMAGLTAGVRNSIDARCSGYARRVEVVNIRPSSTVRVDLALTRDERIGAEPITLSGDALFDPASAQLKPQAVENILEIGRRLNLQPNEVILVAGHTDDKPFPKGSGRDNWVLSGERAAAAARVLTEAIYGLQLPACQVSIMGFGPSRPVEPVLPNDSNSDINRKRSMNRRIEFLRLSGVDRLSGDCVTL